jgi:hypothetical protein
MLPNDVAHDKVCLLDQGMRRLSSGILLGSGVVFVAAISKCHVGWSRLFSSGEFFLNVTEFPRKTVIFIKICQLIIENIFFLVCADIENPVVFKSVIDVLYLFDFFLFLIPLPLLTDTQIIEKKKFWNLSEFVGIVVWIRVTARSFEFTVRRNGRGFIWRWLNAEHSTLCDLKWLGVPQLWPDNLNVFGNLGLGW